MITLFKAIHIAIFGGLVLCLAALCWAAITGVPTRVTWIALALLMAEIAAVGLARGACPLTKWTEKLGAESGSVVDIFLPRWLAERAFVIGGGTLVVALFVLSIRLARR